MTDEISYMMELLQQLQRLSSSDRNEGELDQLMSQIVGVPKNGSEQLQKIMYNPETPWQEQTKVDETFQRQRFYLEKECYERKNDNVRPSGIYAPTVSIIFGGSRHCTYKDGSSFPFSFSKKKEMLENDCTAFDFTHFEVAFIEQNNLGDIACMPYVDIKSLFPNETTLSCLSKGSDWNQETIMENVSVDDIEAMLQILYAKFSKKQQDVER